MREHGGLGDAGGTAGVLQECDVFRPKRDRVVLQAKPGGKRTLECDRTRHAPGGDLLADMAQDEIHHHAAWHAEQVADAGHQDLLQGRARQHLLQHMREILDHHNAFRPGIGELVFQFSSGVQGIRIDHHHAGAQYPEQGDRVLQNVRHHQRHAVARDQTRFLL